MEAREIRRMARESLAGRWGSSILATLVAALLGGAIVGTSEPTLNISEDILYRLPAEIQAILAAVAGFLGTYSLVIFIIGGVVRQGYAVYLLKQYDQRDPQLSDLFSQFNRFSDGFCLNFLEGLYIVLWSLLLFIPGIVKSYAYAMAPFIMAENPDMTARQALRASCELMDGHKAELFYLDLSFIGWGILNLFTMGIGSLWLIPYQNAAHAAFYRNLSYVTVN